MSKKGFTLIELVAVIMILGILLVIIVPRIAGVIDNSRKDAFKATNAMIESEVRRVKALEVTPEVYTFSDGVMTPDLGIRGELPKNGTIEINSEGKIQIVTDSGKYCALKKFDEDVIAIYDSGDTKCNLTQEVALTINPNGGIYDSSTTNTVYQVLPNNSQDLSVPTKVGYIFVGWSNSCQECLLNSIYKMGNSRDTLTAIWKSYTESYTYTGNSTVVEDSNGNWKIKFLTSGTFVPSVDMQVSAFLVGGGGGGAYYDGTQYDSIGGGGGYTKTIKLVELKKDVSYSITIGSGGTASYNSAAGNGETTNAFTYSAIGGSGGGYTAGCGNGGSGGGFSEGNGGSNGSDGLKSNGKTYALGQGSTTREFGEDSEDLYAGGGGGGYWSLNSLGGAGGGGAKGVAGVANTGGGGGSSGRTQAGIGGSGIVVIKGVNPYKCVGATNKYCFKYSGIFNVIDSDKDTWKIKFLTSGTFTPYFDSHVDAFLVGGGGAGTYYDGARYDSVGGGGGYTQTLKLAETKFGTSYPIVVGKGGTPNYDGLGGNGEATSAFTYSALGGYGGGYNIGGNGGSGGGRSEGNGGSDGNNGVGSDKKTYGLGQGSTTREFEEAAGDLYAGAGGGGYWVLNSLGGAGGGGGKGISGTSNTGGGGGSSGRTRAGFGGSGIVVIRKASDFTYSCIGNVEKYCFYFTGNYSVENETNDNWKIKFLSTGYLITSSNKNIDAFLVGGGGGGGSGAGAGGGGGYTLTQSNISLLINNGYKINVGLGGAGGKSDSGGNDGLLTSAFGYNANGGQGGGGWSSSVRGKGGNGGSGGGGGSNAAPGGAGGNDGNNGIIGGVGTFGTGQGSTTREFANVSGTLYGSGGGGGNNGLGSNGASSGGNYGAATNATVNTGGGGGGSGSGGGYNAGNGGSGIVIVRPH